MMMIKMPLACLLLVSYSFYYYSKSKKLQTCASRIFEIMVLCVLVNLAVDWVTEYIINHRNQVPEIVSYICQIVFLLSVLNMCFLMYFYLLAYVERGSGLEKRREKRAALILWGIGSAVILVLSVGDAGEMYGAYLQGTKACVLYACIVYAVAAMLYNLSRHRMVIAENMRSVMSASAAIFSVFFALQTIFPYTFTAGLGMSMVIMGFFLAAEDTSQYIDKKTGFFNELGFRELLWQKIHNGKPFRLFAYVYIGDHTQVEEAIREAADSMAGQYHLACARIADNMVIFLNDSLDWRKEAGPEVPPKFFIGKNGLKEYTVMIPCSENCAIEDIFRQLYIFKSLYEEKALYVDVMSGVYNRNAYERDRQLILKEKRSVWYLLVDINHLKKTNDTYGHAAGDVLIQSAASLLREAFTPGGKVYRIGGDEFAVLYRGNGIEERLKAVEEARQEWNRNRKIPVSFAMGYAYYEPGESTWQEVIGEADNHMYEQKMRKR